MAAAERIGPGLLLLLLSHCPKTYSKYLVLTLCIGAAIGKRHPLRLDEIHFVVMSSHEVIERALYANHTWCSYAESRCTFASPGRICAASGGCLNTMLVSGKAPANCCAQRGFFCKQHRAETLNAQYRFLPALFEYKRRPEFASAKWVVLVDDDAFVFVENLRRHLENVCEAACYALLPPRPANAKQCGPLPAIQTVRPSPPSDASALPRWPLPPSLPAQYPPHVPLYMGEFLEGAGWSFVCGGGGSVLSRAAMERMDLHGCIKSIQRKCMQSDWMLAECAHRSKVRSVKSHGCNSCSHISRKRAHAIIRTRLPTCHFMQQSALFIPYLSPSTTGVPSIIHGYRSEADSRQVMEWFRHTDPRNGSWKHPEDGHSPLGGNRVALVRWRPEPQPPTAAVVQPGEPGGAAAAGAGVRPAVIAVAELSDEQDRQAGRGGRGAAGAGLGAEGGVDADGELDSADPGVGALDSGTGGGGGVHNEHARDQEDELAARKPF
jgi:hypothetical protein